MKHFLQDCQSCFRESSLISWLFATHFTTRMDGCDIWASPHSLLCAKSWVRQSYNIRTKFGTETSAKRYWILETPRYSEVEMCPYGIVLFPRMPVQHKNKKELQTKWWLAENISLGHWGGLVGYCLNNRILTVWELKRELSAHLATTGSNQHAKHSLTAQFCFRLFYCYYEANSFVSDFPHIDFFWHSVRYNFFVHIF